MENKDYSKLLNLLASTGVCKTGKRYLKGTDKGFDTLVKVMKGWPEYLYEHSEVAIDLLRKYIDNEDRSKLEKEGIYIDVVSAKLKTVKNNQTPIFILGNSTITLEGLDNQVIKVYVFNNSDVMILGGEGTFIDVEAWNNSHVELHTEKGVAYCYDSATIETEARCVRKQYDRGEVFNGKELQNYLNDTK